MTTVQETPAPDATSIPTEPVLEVQLISRKQRVLEARGQDVPLDLFLYSCLERERLLNYNTNHVDHKIVWPRPSDFASQPVEALLKSLAGWYSTSFSPMSERKPLDHEHLNEVLASTVAFSRELAAVYRDRMGNDLPDYDKATVADPKNKIWGDIESIIQGAFPAYASHLNRYVQWSHATEPVDDFEPGSRPPVGRYAPRMPRRDGPGGGRDSRGRPGSGRPGPGSSGPRFDRNGPPPRGDRPGSGPRPDRPDRPDRQDRLDRPDRQDHPDRGPRLDGPDRSDRPDRPDRGPRPDRGGDRNRGPRRGPGDEANPKLESAALADVDRAIDELKATPDLNEVTLLPTNSFYRRIQHQKIIDMGFHSHSVGEGPDRAVKVAKKE